MGDDSKTLAALAYLIPIFGGIIVFLIRKGNYERFHAMQSILFWIGAVILFVAFDIVAAIFGLVLGGIIRGLLGIVSLFLRLAVFILWLILAWKAFIGEKLELPFISEQSRKMKGKAAKSV